MGPRVPLLVDAIIRVVSAMGELRGNKAIEDAAITWVMQLERDAGREPRDTRYRGAPADIESAPRMIEVKAFGKSNRGNDLWLETRQVDEAHENPDFYVYVVENVAQGDLAGFKLKVLGGERLARLLERAKEQRYYTVPWPVADYDSAPTDAAGDDLSWESPSQESSDTSTLSLAMSSTGDSTVIVFQGDDAAYLRWLSEHPVGYVVNAERRPRSSNLKLHRADCTWISGRGKPGAYTERDYIKVCSTDLFALKRWARETVGGSLDPACGCS
jgi:Protein NO VEIN, C-terminal